MTCTPIIMTQRRKQFITCNSQLFRLMKMNKNRDFQNTQTIYIAVTVCLIINFLQI